MRSARIFLSGVGGLIALLLVFTYPREAVLVCTSALGLLVIAGFCIPVPRWIFSVRGASQGFDEDRLDGKPFPALVAFEAEVRNLWLLIVSPLYAMGVAAIAIGHYDQRIPESIWRGFANFLGIKVGQWVTAAAVFFAWWWFQERLLLRNAAAGTGFSPVSMGEHGISYQYYDDQGERRAGTSFAWTTVTSLFPVFMHAKNPDFSKPGFGFLFHRFAEIDAKEVPSAVLGRARARLLARAARAAQSV